MAPRKKSSSRTESSGKGSKKRRIKKRGRAVKVAAKKSKSSGKGRSAGKSALRKTGKAAASRKPERLALGMAPGLERLIGNSKKHIDVCRQLAENVILTVVPKAVAGGPLAPEIAQVIAADLERLGFRVIHCGEFGITVSAPAALVSDVLKIDLGIQARARWTRLRATQSFSMSYEAPAPHDLFVAPDESLSVRPEMSEYIDRFLFIPPPHTFAPSPVAPPPGYFAIDAGGIRQLLNVPPGATGAGVNVGMVDSGFFPHPYYVANNFAYRPTPTPTMPNPMLDPEGHGTAMAYNTLAVAPRAVLMGFKKIQQAPHVAIEEAARMGADVITCSWGWRGEQRFEVVEKTIQSVVNQGKIVLFSSGDGDTCWPASMPQVLAIGGVYADQNRQLEASNFASGFTSNYPDYQHRQVPDVCGLCGQRPMGIYITLPCSPNGELDRRLGGLRFPDRDETKLDDGWSSASGTSSATAQIAGVVALMIERARALGRPPLTTNDVKRILSQTATPVQRGRNAQGVPAIGHPNAAVGFGLVNAAAAINAV